MTQTLRKRSGNEISEASLTARTLFNNETTDKCGHLVFEALSCLGSYWVLGEILVSGGYLEAQRPQVNKQVLTKKKQGKEVCWGNLADDLFVSLSEARRVLERVHANQTEIELKSLILAQIER